MTSTFLKVLLLSFCASGLSLAQDSPPRDIRPPRSSTISFEALPFFSGDTSAGLVNIHYRIREDFFVVLRNIESLGPNDFIARGDLLIELQNDQGVSVARHLRSIVLNKNRIPSETDQPADLQGSVSLSVPPGTYTVLFNIEDRQSERSFTNKDQKVITRPPHMHEFDISAPVFVSRSSNGSSDSTVFTALNRGTDILFGESGGFLYTAHIPRSETDFSVRYTMTHHPVYKNLVSPELQGDSFIMDNGLATLDAVAGDTLSIPSRPVRYIVKDDQAEWKTIFVPLPLEQLHPGSAQLKIEFRSGGVSKPFEAAFRVLWLDQPMALRDLDLAVDALQHIASAEEMDAFRTFSESRYNQKFFDFWKKKDPDTTTAYNELMVEYYRRVDAANRQYSTRNEINGYKSDRGRIYILYGSPTHTQRLFSPSGPPKEVWTYTNLKRRFIFEDQRRNGTYVLVALENL